MSDEEGATTNEQLLHAAMQDNLELLEATLKKRDVDINYADGLGNTALHYAAQKGNENVIEKILEQDGCDVDPVNRLDGATPLHMACQLDDDDTRATILWHLLEAGADMSIKDKHGSLAVDLLPGDDEDNKKLFRSYQATNAIAADDIAEDSDGEPGSGSDED